MKFKILLIAILLFPCYLLAQENEQAKKHEDVKWYWIIHLKFKIDKKAEAHEIIKNYWRPIENKIGREQYVYEFETGDWDLIRVVKMEDGISSILQALKKCRTCEPVCQLANYHRREHHKTRCENYRHHSTVINPKWQIMPLAAINPTTTHLFCLLNWYSALALSY